MATQKAITGNVQKNNGGTVFYAGNVPSGATRVTNVLGLSAAGYHSGLHGAIVFKSANLAVEDAITGNVGKMSVGKYVIMKNTTELAGVANTNLLFAGRALYAPSIHRMETIKTSFLYSWSITASSEAGARVAYTYHNNDMAPGNDHAARPTRAVPGEFTYNIGTRTPTNADYAARTG